MKKTLIAASGALALLGSASAFATGTEFTSGSSIAADSSGCYLLEEAVTLSLSASVLGAYECASGEIGVATASSVGRAKVYSADSGGGAVVEADCAADPCVASDVTGATLGSGT